MCIFLGRKAVTFEKFSKKMEESLNKILKPPSRIKAFRTLESYKTDAVYDHFKTWGY